ncbi:MAG: CBS domain-containing protein, partial [Cyanobacteria bacterium P01_H01_bin.130]
FWNYTWLREGLLVVDPGVSFKLLVFGGNFALTSMAFASGAPGGLFAPSLVLGMVLGSWVGWISHLALGVPVTVTYSLVGMGALFGAVSRVPMTAIAIVFEMTADFNVVLPLMIGVVIAYLVADRLDPGSLYDRLLDLRGIRLPEKPLSNDLLAHLKAEDVMHGPVETLDAELRLEAVLQAFQQSHHRGFPVTDGADLVGIVTESDITDWSKLNLPPSTRLRDIMTHHPLTATVDDSVAEIRYMFSRYRLSRVPVLEGRRVVGIVTRSDLLRVEANLLGGDANPCTARKPSYMVYARRSPNGGRGRLLVALGNPYTASALTRLAIAIAQERDFEVECLHPVVVPSARSPADTPIDLGDRAAMLDYAFRLGQQANVNIHVQARTTHDVSQAILETVEQRRVDLVLMEAKGRVTADLPNPGSLGGLSGGIQRLGEKVPCELAILRWAPHLRQQLEQRPMPFPRLDGSSNGSPDGPPDGSPAIAPEDPQLLEILQQLRQWVVFLGGGPNASCALRLLPGLTSLERSAGIHLCQIVTHHQRIAPDPDLLVTAEHYLQRHTSIPITTARTYGDNVLSSMSSVSDRQDASVLVLGASQQNFMQQALHGNLPQQVMAQSDRTILLIRAALNSLQQH